MSVETTGEYSITEQRMRSVMAEPPTAFQPHDRVDWVYATNGSEQWLLDQAADR